MSAHTVHYESEPPRPAACGHFAFGAASALSAAPNPPLPTPGDFGEMFKAGQYRTCLQQIGRVLQLAGDAAKPYDKYALLLLRGDCLLQLNDKPTALVAYAQAEKSPDTTQAAEARAMTLLLRRSNGLSFTPPGGGAMNILDPANRKKGMMLLFEDGLKGAATGDSPGAGIGQPRAEHRPDSASARYICS